MKYAEVHSIIMDEVQCPPYEFFVGSIEATRLKRPVCEDDTWYLQACLYREDTHTGEFGWGRGGKYFLSPRMTAGEVVKKALVAARDYSEHEVREAFLWKGRRVFGPHVPLDLLWDIASEEEVRV